MKRLCVLHYFILFSLNTFSQSIQPFVVNASGGIIQNDKISLDWSLGELAITTLGTPNNLLTQGFLQPLIAPITGISNEFSSGDIIAFPNPFSSHLYFKTSISNIANLAVYDILNRKVLTIKFAHDVDLHHLGNGLYFIVLFDKKQHPICNLKIIKI